MPRPGGRPACAVKAATRGASSLRIRSATTTPSRTLAGIRCRLALELFQRIGAAENDQLVAAAHDRFRIRIEFHLAVLPLNTDDDDAESLPQVRIDDRSPRQRGAGDRNLLHRELEIIGAR